MRGILLAMVACSGAEDPATDRSAGVPEPGCPECAVPADETGPLAACEGTFDCTSEACWVTICGGTFDMGVDAGTGLPNAEPLHTVKVATFELMEAEVTIGHYNACVADGVCFDPESDSPPTFCVGNPLDAPRGCIDYPMARDFCAWAGGRLPTEAEWEYAARSRGKDNVFPWGDGEPTCELAVLGYVELDTCGEGGPAPVCSRPGGSTEQGLCDMGGNIYEWVQDWYHSDYNGAPSDGSAWLEKENPFRVLRGGGINSGGPVTTTHRTFHEPDFNYSGMGVRCAR